MLSLKKSLIALVIVSTFAAYVPQEASADGPLRRWWRNVTGRNNFGCQTNACGVTAQPQTVAANYANPHNLQPGQCMKTCQQTCSRTVVNYVPQTAYRTAYKRVPVTQYRPVTNSDPCTGCTVTCMKPCTSYTYQCQRVPYTTYRPVYRTQTYKVPVTTITNGCATGTCATGNCSTGTCATGTCGNNYAPTTTNYAPTTSYAAPAVGGCSTCGDASAVPNFAPQGQPAPASSTQSYLVDPNTGASTSGGFQPTPANTVPALNGVVNPQSSQRPVVNQFNPNSRPSNFRASTSPQRSVYEQFHQPAVINADDHTAQSPIRKRWSFSPVRFASTETPNERRITSYAGKTETQPRQSRWVEVE